MGVKALLERRAEKNGLREDFKKMIEPYPQLVGLSLDDIPPEHQAVLYRVKGLNEDIINAGYIDFGKNFVGCFFHNL